MGKLLLQIELVENCKKLNIFHPRCLCCYNNYGLFFFIKGVSRLVIRRFHTP